MDSVKLSIWREKFLSEAQGLRVQYDSYLRPRPFEDCFVLKTGDVSGTLTLEILDPQMPEDVKRGLEDLFTGTVPENGL
ncbi:hypothetical protein DIU31_006100 [Mucilaginibacter rubeus]|uniref:Uncharacterized protein n=1 Tax=Mucilaginibacter rubeus TaxID=2027860 RepID=A0AAE6JD26_9SPHI|nr:MULTISPECIES: hypothetical protein [Mucilaginibacter]QEM03113.1 hypothetical protein DIU31_006100 [Mucilaginibacter rubeus]QEM15731.1 hypothetical protein DIU38_006170 [Mucilaginibacter gossypii]QTE41528.1 hypothetical protein J3L19_21605 [Mucilaginibacter rubeus]QTE48134.1 hypothetical protein J3L21_21605 [Mucilaginibacter rubeus]QTE59525.1 hypothetical protein J3L23_13250 [Mucilaginibacter rubeus]